jgi:hypothetical protein
METNKENTEEVVERNDQDAGTETVRDTEQPRADSMARKDAIRASIAQHGDPATKEAPRASEQPTRTEVKDAVNDGDIAPPQEFSAEAKEAWRKKDYARVNKEYERLSRARLAEVTRAQNAERAAREEAKTWRELGERAKPYIEGRAAEGVTPEQAMKEALDLVAEIKKADPATVKAEFKKLGIDLDSATGRSAPSTDPALLERLNGVEKILGEQKLRETANLFSQSIGALAVEKTRTGEPVYPGFYNDSAEGIEFAKELGSLTREPLFINLVRRRFPNATHKDLVREAYIQLGGKVAGDPVKVSTDAQQHIERARKAAASTPGRPVTSKTSNGQIGKLSRRDAVRAAIAEHGGEN